MSSKNFLSEFMQGEQQKILPQQQLDWRWIEHYRELDAFDAYWWWAHAGPFTQEEQQPWNELFSSTLDEATKSHLGKLLATLLKSVV